MKRPINRTYATTLLRAVVALALLAFLLPAALTQYINTRHAASTISGMLSKAVGQPVAIGSIALSDGALQLKGISLANPEGFQASKLLSVDSVIVKPLWLRLLTGKRAFEEIELDGITVDLQRNRDKVWNFDRLLRRFSGPKPAAAKPAPELLVNRFAVSRGTVRVDGREISGLALNISSLATGGSQESGLKLDFEDPARNRYQMTGRARLGTEPEFGLSLASPSISLKGLAGMLRINSPHLSEKGNAALAFSAELRKGILKCNGRLAFSSALLPAAGSTDGLGGQVALAAAYDVNNDNLTLDNLSFQLDSLTALRATGSVRGVKGDKKFTFDIGTDEIDIARVAPLMLDLEKTKTRIAGKLGKGALHMAGNGADGVTTARGLLTFSGGMLVRDRRLLFSGLSVDAALSGTGSGLTVSGKAVQPPSTAKPLLESLQAPYKITLDRRFRVVNAAIPALSVRAQGASLTARATYGNGVGRVEQVIARRGDLYLALRQLTAHLPQKQVSGAMVRYPVNAGFSGCDLQRSDARVKGVSGKIRITYAANGDKKWLEGDAAIQAEKTIWRGEPSGPALLRVEFAESGAKADFKAALLAGSLLGEAAFNPFAPLDKVAFRVNAQGLQLAGAEKYAGQKGDLAFAEGKLDAVAKGSYSASSGLYGRVEADGRGIAVNGKGGKRIFSDGGAKIDSELTGKKLIINQALFTAGKALGVKANGAIENVFAPERQGRIAFTVPDAALGEVADTFLNILPRSLQEATVEGNISAAGAVNLQAGRILLDGSVGMARINIDAPTEKIKVNGLGGALPFSMDLSGKSTVKPPAASEFSRQNHDQLVKQLQQNQENGDTITIGSSSFGGLLVNSVNIRLKAAGGVTEIVSLDSSLFGGTLLGRGFIAMQDGLVYRSDLLFSNLSLVEICKAFPAITGYLSGKADGIVSIQGKGKQLSGITGFTEFWARETSAEKMLVSKEFLQRLSGKKLSGFFFSADRPYDHAGIKAALESGFLTFDSLDISHTNLFGVRDLSVTIAPGQNRIAIDHLLNSIKEATVRGKSAAGAAGKGDAPAAAPATEFKWDE